MSDYQSGRVNAEPTNEKMLNGLVPEDVFWEFKKVAAERKDNMKSAILNAALLYIHAIPEDLKEVLNHGGSENTGL